LIDFTQPASAEDVTSSTGDETFFNIRVLLPDLLPRTADTAGNFKEPGFGTGYGDELDASILGYTKGPKSPEDQLDLDLKNSGKSRSDYSIIGSDYRLYDVPGLDDLFVKNTADGLVYFTCRKITVTPVPSCTVVESTGAGYGSLVLHFDRKYFNQTADINKKFRSLLESFVTNE